jgi:ribose/xylose/arabinose/galactoside ABC-type transport system permease subunit
VLFDGLTLGGTNAFAFDAIVGTAIIVAMVLNQWIARVRQGARG